MYITSNQRQSKPAMCIEDGECIMPEEPLLTPKHSLIFLRITWNPQSGQNAVFSVMTCWYGMTPSGLTQLSKLRVCFCSVFHIHYTHPSSRHQIVICFDLQGGARWEEVSTGKEIKEVLRGWQGQAEDFFFFLRNPCGGQAIAESHWARGGLCGEVIMGFELYMSI